MVSVLGCEEREPRAVQAHPVEVSEVDVSPLFPSSPVEVDVPAGLVDVMDQAGLTADDIDLFVPHQANTRIISATADRLRVPEEKVFLAIHKYGNVSAASIPMSLADAAAEGRLKKGDVVLSAAFGAGFTWAAAVYRW